MSRPIALAVLAAGCGSTAAPVATTSPPPAVAAAKRTIALPGATADGVFLDYLAFDTAHHRVWVPAANTARVDVIDAATGAVTPIEGFVTKTVERNGKTRIAGPTAATVGDSVVFVGNRGDQSICAFDAATLARRGCVTLPDSPDGLQYVAVTHEVWVTTPRAKSIHVLDARDPEHLADTATITLPGEPEGFAVDNARGTFFTNLEDADKTLAIDVHSHAVTATWEPHCGEDGPKGLAYDQPAGHLVVVCPDHLETLDATGATIGTLPVGAGLDSVDYLPSRRELFAAAGRAAKLVVARLDPDGSLHAVASDDTAKGARNAVVGDDGTAYVADGPAGAILVVPRAVLR